MGFDSLVIPVDEFLFKQPIRTPSPHLEGRPATSQDWDLNSLRFEERIESGNSGSFKQIQDTTL